MTPSIAILLKAPRLGTVKTRLAASVGERRALHLYRIMAARTLAAVRETGWPAVVWYTPEGAQAQVRRWLGPDWEIQPQAAGDLGARLAAAARAAGSEGAWFAVGGDCPDLTAETLWQAHRALADADVVIGPTHDGGYYLIGGRTPLPDLFSDIPWSTTGVLAATRHRLDSAKVRWREIATLRDVDTIADARAAGLLT